MHPYKQTRPPLRYAGDGVIELPFPRSVANTEGSLRKMNQHRASLTTQRFKTLERAGKALAKFERKWGAAPELQVVEREGGDWFSVQPTTTTTTTT